MSKENFAEVNQPQIKKTMTEGSIWQKILLFAIPIMLSNMFNQFYTAVDSAIVGRFISYQALAAVGANNSIVNLMTCLFLGLGVGGGVIVAQYYGAKDNANVQKSVHTVVLLSIICGIFLTVIGFFLAKNLLQLINTPSDVLDLSTSYLKIYFIGVTSVLFYNVGAGILRAVGNSLMPFIYLFVSCIINIGLDFWFVKGLGWGVEGAAWATVISQTVSALCVLVQLVFTRGVHRLTLRQLKMDKGILKQIVKIGLPIGIQTGMYSMANLLIQANLNRFGSVVMAGWVAANKVDCFAFAPVSALGSAVNTYVGQNYGAKEYTRIKKGTYSTLIMAEITSFLMMIPLLTFSSQILSVFNDDPRVIEYGRQIMFLVIPTYMVFAFSDTISGMLKGIGRSAVSALISFVGVLLVRALWLYIVLPIFNTTDVLFWVHPISWIVTAVIFAVYVIAMGWKRILKITPEQEKQIDEVGIVGHNSHNDIK